MDPAEKRLRPPAPWALLVGLSLLAMAGPAWAQQASQVALKIVVIEGEGAVNIIQQKTAVAPVVEVRDRNDLPVSGAAVTFTISGGNTATFAGGAQALTVTTNAAGRAVVGALNPLGSGAVQINVQAAFQGQTAAATIAQTNVMTAAQATVASGSGASTGGSAGGAAGGGTGGGLSTTTLSVVGAAAAGGAIAATKLTGDEGNSSVPIVVPTVRYSGTYSGAGTRVFSFPCMEDLANSGTVFLDLKVAADGTVSGTGGVTGTLAVVAVIPPGCVAVPETAMHGCCVPPPPVNGTTASLAFNGSHPGNLGTTWSYAFSGALSDPDIIGTFTLTVTGGNLVTTPPVPVRLTKSGQ